MAGTATKRRVTARAGTYEYQLGVEHNKVVTDLETLRASLDAGGVTAVTELMADHATFVTVVTDLKTLLNNIRTYLTGDRLFSGNPGLAIDTNFDVQSANAVVVSIDGVLATIAGATCDTGTAATFPATKWGIFLVSAQAGGTLTATWATNAAAGYDSEALAIAALPAAPASEAPIGYVTVQAHGSNSFTAGTDALQGGTGGNPSPDTNYYNLADPASTISAAVSTSAPATLSASVPSATAVDEAADLTASQIADNSGTAYA